MPKHNYPERAVLRDGRRVLIRPFREEDVEALHGFFRGLPATIQRFAWDRIHSRGLVETWAREIDYNKVLPLLAFDGPRVVADASLHRRQGGPLRLVGRMKWLIDPDFRGVGLGATLVNLLMDHARESGLRHVTSMLITDVELDAISVLTELGFQEHRLPGYGVDPDGGDHDMTKLIFSFSRSGAASTAASTAASAKSS